MFSSLTQHKTRSETKFSYDKAMKMIYLETTRSSSSASSMPQPSNIAAACHPDKNSKLKFSHTEFY